MRRQAKAPSARSSEVVGSSSGPLSRALATRGASSHRRGTGAPALWLLTPLGAVLALLVFVSSAAAAPSGAVSAVSAVSYTSAHVTGTVTADADEGTFWKFQYSSDGGAHWTGFGSYEGPLFPGSGTVPVEADLTGLKGGTDYLVRLLVPTYGTFPTNDEVDTEKAVVTDPLPFTTLVVTKPTVLSTNDAASPSYTSAMVSGSIERPANPDPAFDANCRFEYVTEAQFQAKGFEEAGRKACDVDPVTTPGPSTADAELTGLHPSTVYHFRLVAENAGGSDAMEAGDTFITAAVAPATVTIDPVTTVTGGTAHFSGTINPGAPAGNPSAYDVSWHFECKPECPGLETKTIEADADPHTVEADAEGLEPNTSYEVFLVAENAGGPAKAGPANFKTNQVAPEAWTLYAGSVSTDSAVLAAKVNTRNAAGTYQFEWGTGTSYGNLAPATPQSVGSSDNNVHIVTAPVSGLQQGVTYHFRVVLTNTETSTTVRGEDHGLVANQPAAQGPCPNPQFRGGVAALLPDCRAYEMVSPPFKSYSDILTSRSTITSLAGNEAAYSSAGAFAGTPSAPAAVDYFSKRTDAGWTTKSMTLPITGGGIHSTGSNLYGENLKKAFVVTDGSSPTGLAPGDEAFAGKARLYVHNTESDKYTFVSQIGAYALAGASADSSHFIFSESEYQLLPEAPPYPASSVYEWTGAQLQLASILPSGDPATERAQANAISKDGKKVVFSVGGKVYVRVDGTSTFEASAPQRPVKGPDPAGPQEARYEGASANGSTVLLSSSEELTDDANTGTGDEGRDLYAFSTGTHELTDLTPGSVFAGSAGARSERVLAVSNDGGYVYFLARGKLLGSDAVEGELNLYVLHGSKIGFIATLSSDDLNTAPHISDAGNVLAFMSTAPLTGFSSKDPETGQAHAEVFLYDATSNSMRCASCVAGVPVKGDAHIGIPSFTSPLRVGSDIRNLSADGQRVFFETPNPLLPADTNGLAPDVYQYDSSGLSLISSGQAQEGARFEDASADGSDVFITTRQRLFSLDTDSNIDVYDVRIDGGFPAPDAEKAGPCSGESCKGPATSPARVDTPGTALLHGEGNRARKAGAQTRYQRFARALKACKKKRKSGPRKKCEAKARKRFGRAAKRGDLASALKACRKKKSGPRKKCEAKAHKHFGKAAKSGRGK